jgi:hypothetical protein
VDDLLFPEPHLKVDQPVLFQLVAQGDQIIHQAGDTLGRKNVVWLTPCSQRVLGNFFLFLSESLPGNVEFFPQFETFGVSSLVIVVQT